jgi:quinol monooxygenase YgiN
MAVQVVDDTLPEPFQGESSPYTLLVILRAKPDRADDLNELLLRQVDQTRAEPGSVVYYLNRGRSDRTTFYFYEAYSSISAFRDHLDSPYIKRLLAELPPYLTTDVEMIFLTMESSRA